MRDSTGDDSSRSIEFVKQWYEANRPEETISRFVDQTEKIPAKPVWKFALAKYCFFFTFSEGCYYPISNIVHDAKKGLLFHYHFLMIFSGLRFFSLIIVFVFGRFGSGFFFVFGSLFFGVFCGRFWFVSCPHQSTEKPMNKGVDKKRAKAAQKPAGKGFDLIVDNFFREQQTAVVAVANRRSWRLNCA